MTDSIQTDPTHRASFASDEEIDAFLETLGKYERGEIDADAWRAYRVARGVYPQRQGDAIHMLRVKLPQGLVDSGQLRALADVARSYSRGFGHVTTRQNFQLHFVRPDHLEPAMRRLAAAGITTSGACGNTVRNVVACPLAGVSPSEAFDVTPYAEAVTRWFLRHPLGMSLPRKFKIGFEGCAEDHVATAIHDIGFRARVRAEGGRAQRGFAVTVAGGTSTVCSSGNALVEFLPAGEILALAEAIVRVFHARGDRANRQRNRLKFLVRALGFDAFRSLVEAELAKVQAEGGARLPFDPDAPVDAAPPARHPGFQLDPVEIARRIRPERLLGPGEPPLVEPILDPGASRLERFVATNVQRQRQPGFSVVSISVPQGDVTATQLEVLAEVVEGWGDGTARFSNRGHLVLRWIPEASLPAVHAALAAASLARDGAGSAADVVACPGADACRLAVTRTRGIARLVEEHVRATLGEAATGTVLPVNVSGCPNGCSQHHLAAIGLQGSARKLGADALPQYFVLLGGGATDGQARFGRIAAKIPVRRVPDAIRALVSLYLAERLPGESAGPFFARSFERAKAAIAPYQELRLEDARAEDFVEPGVKEPFRTAQDAA
jgi:sulfite reductase (NADPH) hemoprotein beta-component